MRIVLADDSLLVREGLTRLLEHLGHEVLAQADGPDRLLAHVAEHRPHVVLIDIKMPPTYTDEGLRAAAAIHRQHADVGVLVLSQYVVVGYATALFDQAPTRSGYLLKDRLLNGGTLDDGLRRVAAGGTVIDPELVRVLLEAVHSTDPIGVLSGREQEILALLGEGLSDRGIARTLFISPNTVERTSSGSSPSSGCRTRRPTTVASTPCSRGCVRGPTGDPTKVRRQESDRFDGATALGAGCGDGQGV